MATFKPKGTCSTKITFEIEEGIIRKCSFDRGCTGNLEGLSRLVVGKPAEEVADMLSGIQCQNGTSCPDQLSRALRQYLAENH